jgi:hypothetical protein
MRLAHLLGWLSYRLDLQQVQILHVLVFGDAAQ